MPISNIFGLDKWDDADNHDSKLNLTEMKELIQRIPTEIAEPNSECNGNIRSLFAAFKDKAARRLEVVKGIHQADQLHYTVALLTGGCYHIYVAKSPHPCTVETQEYQAGEGAAAGKKKLNGTRLSYELFYYKNVGVTYLECDKGTYNEKRAGTAHKWPATFSKNSYSGRVRRLSFCVGNSDPIANWLPSNKEAREFSADGSTPELATIYEGR